MLTQVHGKPTYETLQVLATELKANAGSVPSTLGGGSHGHLGFLLSDIRYATLQNTIPWVTLGNPGPFVPPACTAAVIEAAKDVWKELKQQFDLCQATEKALVAQIVDPPSESQIPDPAVTSSDPYNDRLSIIHRTSGIRFYLSYALARTYL